MSLQAELVIRDMNGNDCRAVADLQTATFRFNNIFTKRLPEAPLSPCLDLLPETPPIVPVLFDLRAL